MNLSDLVEQCWAEHGDKPQAVADRFPAVFASILNTKDALKFVELVTHIEGGHLGHWDRAAEWLDKVRTHASLEKSEAFERELRIAAAALDIAGSGRDPEEGAFDKIDGARVYADAAMHLAERGTRDDAVRRFSTAAQLASSESLDAQTALSLAMASNNLAWNLLEAASSEAKWFEPAVECAQYSLQFWTLAGSWVEVERAHYLVSKTMLAAGKYGMAREHAEACLKLCEQNNASPYELLFAFDVLARAAKACGDSQGFINYRAGAIQSYAKVPEQEKQWCEQAIVELRTMSP